MGLYLLTGGNGGVVWAEQTVPSGITALLIGTVPIWIVLLDWLRPFPWLRSQAGGERPPVQALAGLVIGLGGLALLVGANDAPHDRPVLLPGILVLILSTLSWATGSLYGRSARLPASPLLGTGMEMMAGGIGLLVLGTLTGEWTRLDPAGVSARSAAAMGYLIIFGAWVAFSAYVWLLRNAPTPLVATYAYVNPVVAILLGNLLAAEPITLRELVAAAAILGAAILTTTAHQAMANRSAKMTRAEAQRDIRGQERV